MADRKVPSIVHIYCQGLIKQTLVIQRICSQKFQSSVKHKNIINHTCLSYPSNQSLMERLGNELDRKFCTRGEGALKKWGEIHEQLQVACKGTTLEIIRKKSK